MGFWIGNWLIRAENFQTRRCLSGLISSEVAGGFQSKQVISGQNAI